MSETGNEKFNIDTSLKTVGQGVLDATGFVADETIRSQYMTPANIRKMWVLADNLFKPDGSKMRAVLSGMELSGKFLGNFLPAGAKESVKAASNIAGITDSIFGIFKGKDMLGKVMDLGTLLASGAATYRDRDGINDVAGSVSKQIDQILKQ